MKRGSTVFLKFVLCVMALGALAIAIFAVPQIPRGGAPAHSHIIYFAYLFMGGLYVSAIPFLIALLQAWKLLTYIDTNTAFSENSVTALKIIKYCAIVISILFTTGIPFLFQAAQIEDAPALGLLSLAFAASPLVVAVFAAVLQKLIRNGLDIKSENDLTV